MFSEENKIQDRPARTKKIGPPKISKQSKKKLANVVEMVASTSHALTGTTMNQTASMPAH